MVKQSTPPGDRLQAAMAGLFRHRLMVLAAVLALAAVYVAGSPVILLAGMVLVVLAALATGLWDRSHPLVSEQESGTDASLEALGASDLAAAVPDPLLLFDREGVVLYANAAAIGAFGPVTPGVSVQLRFRAPEMQELLRQTLARPAARAIDYAERVPVERWFQVTAAPVGRAGSVFALQFRDQSETRRIDRMRSDFIANASHELRTPLASISGFIETLRGPAKDDPKAREQFLQIMQNQTSRMARLIDDLLSLSRLEMKPFLKPTSRTELKEIVESVADSLAPLARESGVTVIKELPPDKIELPGNRDELFQVFENLLENACKYGASGGRVVITCETNDAEASVTIQDFGPGIPEEHIPRVTERFYRVDVETSRAQKGTGLGLAIVKHILSRHEGRLSIKSELGKGSSFTVHLPRN